MAVKIRLRRMGAKKRPFYRLVVADARSPRDGRFIEAVGTYDPLADPALVRIQVERVKEWMSKGARPTDVARQLLIAEGVIEGPRREHAPAEKRPRLSKKAQAREAAAAEAAAAPPPAEPAASEAEAAPPVPATPGAEAAGAETTGAETPAEGEDAPAVAETDSPGSEEEPAPAEPEAQAETPAEGEVPTDAEGHDAEGGDG